MHFSFSGECSSTAGYLSLTFLKRKRRSYMLAFSCNHTKHLQTLMVCFSKPVKTGRFIFFFLSGEKVHKTKGTCLRAAFQTEKDLP